MSRMASDGDIMDCSRRLSTLIRADAIQPYLHCHIYWPHGPLR